MNLATLLTAIWFILFGVNTLGWVGISVNLLGLLAFITGLVWLLESMHPITLWRRP
jgi:hypothetical protein